MTPELTRLELADLDQAASLYEDERARATVVAAMLLSQALNRIATTLRDVDLPQAITLLCSSLDGIADTIERSLDDVVAVTGDVAEAVNRLSGEAP